MDQNTNLSNIHGDKLNIGTLATIYEESEAEDSEDSEYTEDSDNGSLIFNKSFCNNSSNKIYINNNNDSFSSNDNLSATSDSDSNYDSSEFLDKFSLTNLSNHRVNKNIVKNKGKRRFKRKSNDTHKELNEFEDGGYAFNKKESSKNKLVFKREKK